MQFKILRSFLWFELNRDRPKNRLSLEHLKYLHSVLEKNSMVSESNRSLLVESLRCIAEILIWGDQHDSSVFDFFLEKNMLSYFLHIMRQKNGGSNFVCVQLLQTLNILFENIRNETSLYYLLSNNHVNSIIVHKFDFSDEDVMGYYILFLKTLSLKLNVHTIHFFFNEHTNDFPLYTEAIKFFNHSESMVRIAVRTITLNVYKIQNTSMLQFIRDKTAAPYFSNLVWFIGKHIIELDACLKIESNLDKQCQPKLSNLVAEHLDHLHYLNDILHLEINDLNAVLTSHLIHKLFVPLCLYSLNWDSLTKRPQTTEDLFGNLKEQISARKKCEKTKISPVVSLYLLSLVFLVISHSSLVHPLAWLLLNADYKIFQDDSSSGFEHDCTKSSCKSKELKHLSTNQETQKAEGKNKDDVNITDEEKEKKITSDPRIENHRPFLDFVLEALNCEENDYYVLIALCLLYAIAKNKGGTSEILESVLNNSDSNLCVTYKNILIDKLLQIIAFSNKSSCQVRLITLDISLSLLLHFSKTPANNYFINSSQHSCLMLAKSQSMKVLYHFYKSEDLFLDLFEHEYNEMKKTPLNVEFLCMDQSILIQPNSLLSTIPLVRRFPVTETEKARRAIRIFLLLRVTCQKYLNESENLLPLTNCANCVEVNNVLDLNSRDLIGCTVLSEGNVKQRRFLVIDNLQFILVEPDTKRLGWGIAKYVGFLHDAEVLNDKDDPRSLNITVQSKGSSHTSLPQLKVKFIFDDHIRCMAAKQRLIKGRSKARQKKMYQIAQLLEIPIHGFDSVNNTMDFHCLKDQKLLVNSSPGFAAVLGKSCKSANRSINRVQVLANSAIQRKEEIPLEDFQSTLNISSQVSCATESKENSISHEPEKKKKPSNETSFIAADTKCVGNIQDV